MSVIDEIIQRESAEWIISQIDGLPDRGKFRAASALRSLQWANGIFDAGMHIPACFCALHATEEAVAAFISCAKECDYNEAKDINIKDHAAKATVSLLAQKVSEILLQYKVAVALNTKPRTLIARYILDGQTHYNEASTKLFHYCDDEGTMLPDFYDELVKMFDDVNELKKTVRVGQEARNTIFYASSKGYPTGFDDPSESLCRECQLTLGLIWGAIDLTRNAGQKIPFIEQALRTANIVIADLKKR
ncbi:hypothetical protein [Shimia marina]|uniref:HEPN domain protein n=1 Tax=Shimia marina TaxID=321267 RepID=A0A0P1EQB2_9RHOB|nr:hypothetical protein [Shimia marina]CUH52645.1 hypothetical protein SHM7688_02092 [Shimia marina]SFE68019.1 hypothetical protein SAMN04488037_11524 [Shimia marina]